MRRHHIVGIPPSELGGIATPGQDPKGRNAGSGSGSSQEHPARHPGHGVNLPPLVFTLVARLYSDYELRDPPPTLAQKCVLHIGWRRTPDGLAADAARGESTIVFWTTVVLFWTTGLAHGGCRRVYTGRIL